MRGLVTLRSPQAAVAVSLLYAALTAVVSCSMPPVVGAPRRVVPVASTEPGPSEEDALIDLSADGGAPERHLVPRHPEQWQKPPPCDEEAGERVLYGACYVELKRTPPCGPKLLESEKGCYRAIKRAEREPSSLGR